VAALIFLLLSTKKSMKFGVQMVNFNIFKQKRGCQKSCKRFSDFNSVLAKFKLLIFGNRTAFLICIYIIT